MKVYVVMDEEFEIFSIFDSLEKAKSYALEEAEKDPLFIPDIDGVKFVFKEINYKCARYCIYEIAEFLDYRDIRFYIQEFEVK